MSEGIFVERGKDSAHSQRSCHKGKENEYYHGREQRVQQVQRDCEHSEQEEDDDLHQARDGVEERDQWLACREFGIAQNYPYNICAQVAVAAYQVRQCIGDKSNGYEKQHIEAIVLEADSFQQENCSACQQKPACNAEGYLRENLPDYSSSRNAATEK